MVRRHAQVLAEALDILREHPDFRFYVETWNEQFDTFLQRFPKRIPEMRRAVQNGQIGIAGAYSNQHPGWMEQESLVRDMVLGRRLFSEFAPGVNLDVMSHIDVTPRSSQMPQLLVKAGYRYYRLHRPEGMNVQQLPRDFVCSCCRMTRSAIAASSRPKPRPSSCPNAAWRPFSTGGAASTTSARAKSSSMW